MKVSRSAHSGLYVLKFPLLNTDHLKPKSVQFNKCMTVGNAASDTFDLLHCRLGHASLSKMKHIAVCHTKDVKVYDCESCIFCKNA